MRKERCMTNFWAANVEKIKQLGTWPNVFLDLLYARKKNNNNNKKHSSQKKLTSVRKNG